MELISETEPLIKCTDDNFEKEKKNCLGRVFPTGIKNELISMLKIAIPVIITNLMLFLIMTESVIFSGQISKYQLDGVSLANSIINVLGSSICIGFTTACDTIFSQIFGSKHKKSMGMILQRSLIIITLAPIILIGIQINLGPLFIVLKQDSEVSRIADRFLTVFSPGLLFVFYFLVFARYMQTQNRVYAPMVVGIIVNVNNIWMQYVFVRVLGYGIDATAVCQIITYVLFTVLEIVYIIWSGLYKDTWDGFTRDAFLNWGTFLSLAIPGAMMIMLESMCFEIGTFLAGVMNPVQQAVQSILYQLEGIIFMICFGVGVATNIRVGQALGANNHEKALTAYRCGLLIIIVFQCFTGTMVLTLKNYLPRLFTNDEEVIEIASEILPYLVGVQFMDAIGAVTNGALRGCGKQKWCVLNILCSFYILGLPLGIYLAFGAGFQVKGIWIGIFVALCICVPVATIYTNLIQNWKKQAENCSQQMKRTTEILKQMEIKDKEIVDSLPKAEHRRSLSRDITKVHGSNSITMTAAVITDQQYHRVYIQRGVVFLITIGLLVACMLIKIFITDKWMRTHTTSMNVSR